MTSFNKSGLRIMLFFYAAMIGTPLLLVIYSYSFLISNLDFIRSLIYPLIGLGSLVFGFIGLKQVYLHG